MTETEVLTKDLEKYEQRHPATVHAIHQQNDISIVERLAANKDVDVDKLQKIIDMQNAQLDRNAEQSFNADMVLAQAEIRTAFKNKSNDQTHSKYADLESVIKSAKPIYTKHGFALSFYEGESPNEAVRVMVDVMHRDGHTKVRHSDFGIDDEGIAGKKNKTSIHGKGSTFSYGRRYLTCMIFNIPTGDDDDGNSAGAPEEPITDEQSKHLVELAAEVGADYKKFCKFFKVDDTDNLPASKYKAAIAMLEKKRAAAA